MDSVFSRTNGFPSARLVVAGTASGVGKTTIVVGLIAALRARGLTVQPFKVGPDYIDPTYHELAADRPCRNLDGWMVPADRLVASFGRASREVDFAAIEGVMGLFDGNGYEEDSGSTAAAAKLLKAPVVLTIDAAKTARSAGALALGFSRFDPELNLVGFIVNRVGGDSHGRGVSAAIERATGLPVFGYFERDASLAIPERYLGLIPAREPGRRDDFVRAAGSAVASRLDLDKLLSIARQAPPLRFDETVSDEIKTDSTDRPVIAVARDEAFHFQYPENLELLEAAGAKIAYFSPLRDRSLPADASGLIFCGGFPELHAEAISANRSIQDDVRQAHRSGTPIYAECGGLMYLTEAIQDDQGRAHPMVGLLPGRSSMTGRLTLGYRRGRAVRDSWLLKNGEEIRGHEFHYSSWIDRPGDLPAALELRNGNGEGMPKLDGASFGNLWASYLHLHFDGSPELPRRFVSAAREAKR